jgi:uncharacterized membrane protein
MAAFYIFAGYSHFKSPKFFLRITPKWVPAPEKVNILVGAIEVLLGVLVIIPATRDYGVWGIIALLIAVFPANVYHFQKALSKGKMIWQTALRLPFQALLIWWAYSFLSTGA